MHKTFTFLSLIAACAVLGVGLASCSGDNADDANVIKIGHYASITGKQATFGTQVDNGVRLAVEEINNNGGVLGKKIKLITEDTQSKTDQAMNAVEKLIGRDNVVALIGEVASSNSLAAAPIAERAKVPMVSPASTNKDVTLDPTTGKALPYIFRICFIDPFQGAGLASFVHTELKANNVAMLIDKANPYSVGLADGFRQKFSELGGQITEEQTYEGGQQDFKAQLTAINATGPDAIFIPGYYTEVSLIAQQARDLGITAPLVGGDGWDSPELTKGAAKQALEGAYFSNHFSEQDTAAVVQEFIAKYNKRFHEDPGAMSALGYDAMKIIAHVIQQADTVSSKAIRDGLENLKDYPGVTGSITINDKHNASKPMVILQIHDGKFIYHSTIMPDGTIRGGSSEEAATAAADTSASGSQSTAAADTSGK